MLIVLGACEHKQKVVLSAFCLKYKPFVASSTVLLETVCLSPYFSCDPGLSFIDFKHLNFPMFVLPVCLKQSYQSILRQFSPWHVDVSIPSFDTKVFTYIPDRIFMTSQIIIVFTISKSISLKVDNI